MKFKVGNFIMMQGSCSWLEVVAVREGRGVKVKTHPVYLPNGRTTAPYGFNSKSFWLCTARFDSRIKSRVNEFILDTDVLFK